MKSLSVSLLLCALLMVGGCTSIAGSDGYGNRTDYAIERDTDVARTLWDRIRQDEALDGSHINVDVYNGFVLLTGQVPDERVQARADELARSTPEVRRVRNALTVGPNTATTQRLRDTWVTAQARARLAASEHIDSNRVRILTEDGVVYLMGLVRPGEADYVVNVVADARGVARIVKVFEYLN